MGNALTAQGEYAKAADYYRESMRINSDTSVPYDLKWFTGRPEENFGLSMASDTEAYAGHLGKARELTKLSVDFAIRDDSKETGAIWYENAALREAAFGTRRKRNRLRGRDLSSLHRVKAWE